MDSYNRGYQQGLNLLGNYIGNIEVDDHSGELGTGLDQSHSFFAQSYIWGNQTIIAYRGTDAPIWDFPDWGVGLGYPDSDQTRLAADFYKLINNGSIAPNANITLTGYSLGVSGVSTDGTKSA